MDHVCRTCGKLRDEKMASSPSALSNISICYPPNKIPPPTRSKKLVSCNSIKAVAGGARDTLDRAQQRLPNQRLLHVVPAEPLYRFPASRRMMEDPLDGFSRGRTPWAIRESEKDYKVRFDVPGMSKDDVKVWVEEKMLVFKAQKAQEQQQGQVSSNDDSSSNIEEDWPAKSFGRYGCRIVLPENIAFEDIKAQVKDGVLYMTIPKATNTTKTVDIQVE